MQITEKEVSKFILRGLAMKESDGLTIIESKSGYLFPISKKLYASILGLTLLGKCGQANSALELYSKSLSVSSERQESLLKVFADLIGIDIGLARSMRHAHASGIPASKIAAALKSGELSM